MVAVAAATTMAFAGGVVAPIEEVEIAIAPVNNGFYIGGAYGFETAESTVSDYNYEYTTFDNDYDSIMVNAGYNINEFVAVEGRYWFGVEQTVDYGAMDGYLYSVDSRLDTWGIYVKPQYSFDAVKVYGLLGYASSEYDLTGKLGVIAEKYSETLDGFSWGLGAAYSFNDNIDLFVDYVNMYDDKTDFNDYGYISTYEDTISTVNVGVIYNF